MSIILSLIYAYQFYHRAFICYSPLRLKIHSFNCGISPSAKANLPSQGEYHNSKTIATSPVGLWHELHNQDDHKHCHRFHGNNNFYYTSPEICLYKSNMLDWYVIPRDKVKNITYGYANERVGLITNVQFVWIKSLRHINYAVAHS